MKLKLKIQVKNTTPNKYLTEMQKIPNAGFISRWPTLQWMSGTGVWCVQCHLWQQCKMPIWKEWLRIRSGRKIRNAFYYMAAVCYRKGRLVTYKAPSFTKVHDGHSGSFYNIILWTLCYVETPQVIEKLDLAVFTRCSLQV